MKFLPILLFVSFANAENVCKDITCDTSEWKSYCKVQNEDLRDVTQVSFVFDSETRGPYPMHLLAVVDSEMSDVPMGIFSTFDLSFLLLKNNKLRRWQSDYLENATSLAHLTVNTNLITHLPANSFAEAPSLYLIDLDSNRIREISPEAFAGLESLVQLNLNSNRLGPILAADFHEVGPSLKVLSLKSNGIRYFPSKLLTSLPELVFLNLRINIIDFVDIRDRAHESLEQILMGEAVMNVDERSNG